MAQHSHSRRPLPLPPCRKLVCFYMYLAEWHLFTQALFFLPHKTDSLCILWLRPQLHPSSNHSSLLHHSIQCPVGRVFFCSAMCFSISLLLAAMLPGYMPQYAPRPQARMCHHISAQFDFVSNLCSSPQPYPPCLSMHSNNSSYSSNSSSNRCNFNSSNRYLC